MAESKGFFMAQQRVSNNIYPQDALENPSKSSL